MKGVDFVYMIRRRADGLFSTGGCSPRFSKKGKEWKVGALKNHFNLTKQRQQWIGRGSHLVPLPYNDIEHEVVQVEVVKKPVGTLPISDLVREMGQAKVKKGLA